MFLFARKHNIKKGLFFSYSVNKNSKFVISSSGYFAIMTAALHQKEWGTVSKPVDNSSF